MTTVQKTKGNVICNEDLFNLDEFLLVHESSQQAFMNLSTSKNTFSKKELLDETKKLLQEHIMKQIKTNKVSLKKPRNKKKDYVTKNKVASSGYRIQDIKSIE